ncbi:hypothetical protein KJ885_04580 [Patescibacteria group bacterium]|nr:hypothetical protein [Patescibacteria group bacterium]
MRYKLVDEAYEDLFVELGAIFISKCCRITVENFLAFIYYDGQLPEHTIAQLNFLAEVVENLIGAYRRWDGSVQKWFRRRRKELGNLSAYQIMRWPGVWKPEDKRARKILQLAKGVNSEAT